MSKSEPEKNQAQSERFIEAARELGCDETEEGFAEIVRKVANVSAPPPAPLATKPIKRDTKVQK